MGHTPWQGGTKIGKQFACESRIAVAPSAPESTFEAQPLFQRCTPPVETTKLWTRIARLQLLGHVNTSVSLRFFLAFGLNLAKLWK